MSACAWSGSIGTVVVWALIAAPIAAQHTARVSVAAGGVQTDLESGSPSVSADGRYVAFKSLASLVSEDTNGRWDIYVRDRHSSTNERVSVDGSRPIF